MISMNSKFLEEIIICGGFVDDENALALCQCSNLKSLSVNFWSLRANFDLGSLLQKLPALEYLVLTEFLFTRQIVEIISQQCLCLKSLELGDIRGFGDEELSILVEGCPHLRSLELSFLEISEKSVDILMKNRPQVGSVCLHNCPRVSAENSFLLLREITIPTIFNGDEDERLQISALHHLSQSIPHTPYSENPLISDFFSHESLLQRLVDLLALKSRSRSSLISFFHHLAQSGYSRLLIEVGIVPLLIRNFAFFICEEEIYSAVSFLKFFSFEPSQQYLLSSGVLSIFRPRLLLLKVSSLKLE
jgi:hypothetical protein